MGGTASTTDSLSDKPSPKHIYFFGEGSKDLSDLLGGKGANLHEMTNLRLPIPPGFTITTEACKKYQETGALPKDLQEQINKAIPRLEEITGKTFGGKDPLIVSVRSGAKFSMPGMMDTILNLGINDTTAKNLAKKTKNKGFAYDCYKRLIQMFGDVVLNIPPESMQKYLTNTKKIIKNDREALIRQISENKKLTAGLKGKIIEEAYKAIITKENTRFSEKPKTSDLLESIKKLGAENLEYKAFIEKFKELTAGLNEEILIDDPKEIRAEAKVGMRVVGKGRHEGKYLGGLKGTIKVKQWGIYGVEWDKYINGHSLDGRAKKYGHGWNVRPEGIRLYLQSGLGLQRLTDKQENLLFKKILKTKNPELETELLKSYFRRAGTEFPQDVCTQLRQAIESVFNSWNNKRAIKYRKMNNIPDDLGTAVNIQLMVFGNKGKNCAAGVAFSRSPVDGKASIYGEYLPNAQGEDIVAGVKTPKPISELKKENKKAYEQLVSVIGRLEKHYKDAQDLEFTIEKGKLWVLQTRKSKRSAIASLRIAADMVKEGLISEKEAITKIDPYSLSALSNETIDTSIKYTVIAKGTGASLGVASGEIALTPEKAEEYAKQGKKCILVRNETSPEDLSGIATSVGVLTKTGGSTSHAALVTRAMNKCCITGCKDLEIEGNKLKINGKEYHEGEIISLNGWNGEVIQGEVKIIKNEKNINLEKIIAWSEKLINKTIEINADTPKEIRNYLKERANLGLCRTEHLFFMNNNLGLIREYATGDNTAVKENTLKKIRKSQAASYKQIFDIVNNKIRVMLLNCSLDKFLPSKLEISYMKKNTEQSKKAEAFEKNKQTRRGIYDQKEMEEIYSMQVRAISDAYSKTKNDLEVEVLIPDYVPKNERPHLQAVLNKIIPEDAKITINPDSDKIYLIQDIKKIKPEKIQGADTIVVRPKYLQQAKIILAQYLTQGEKNGH